MKFIVAHFVFLFPTLANALECLSDGRCVIEKNSDVPEFEDYKKDTCEDACVYFKCVMPGQKIMEGAGCYRTFESICKFIKTETKTKIIENLRNDTFQYYDESLMFVSCRNKDNCARDAFQKMLNEYPEANRKFATLLNDARFERNERKLKCYYSEKDLYEPMQHQVRCTTREICESGSSYDVEYAGGDVENYNMKSCDACVYYRCATNGTNIISGTGCYDAFRSNCDDKGIHAYTMYIIKHNIKESFYYDKNFIVVTCSSGNNCHKKYYKNYMDVYPQAALEVNANSTDGKCNIRRERYLS